ncbi:MAG: transglycosylase SLT domain-containing protein, partial [Halioglobus sp.]|nr:transglycosylase SLT domain-containing protein [Halioglobus sp.]
GARELWVHGRSRPDECDPLFDAWMRVGQLDDDLVWARLLATFDARQKRLMAYVARKGSTDLQPWSDLLQRVYARPRDINRVDLPAHKARSADIATHGLSYLARYSPEQALSGWRSMQSRLDFSAQQRARVERTIARRSLFARTDAHREWLHDVLARLGDDTLTGIRLRWALRERDWAALERTLPLLSEQEQQEGVWRYWQAVALEQRGALDEARALQEALATERGYYSFLAADRLGVTYAFNARPLPQPEPLAWGDHPVLERIEELHFHDAQTLAHAEWYKLLQDTPEAGHKAQLARLASDRGWHRMAIDAAARARAWDALDVRFPLAYQNVFDYHAGAQQVPSTELLAISRRESAFFPWARSSVGARGLMQIMPATGRQVAASINTRHSAADLYEIDHNVKLGSTYYRQLLDRFGGNRIFALSAYNAGPHRVDRWRNDGAEQVPVDIWVETIPFHETRNYVQAVLAYNVVFQYLMGEDMQTLLTDAERRATY